MGPLNGYTIIELAGIGPAPMGGMMLADMGAEVIRIDRASGANALVMKDVSAGARNPWCSTSRSPRVWRPCCAWLKTPMSLSIPIARVCAKSWDWSRCLPGAQSEAGICAHDRLGPGGSAGSRRGTRYQLHFHYRRAVCHGAQGRKAGPATEPGGGHGRRRHAAGQRRPGGAAGSRKFRQRAGH